MSSFTSNKIQLNQEIIGEQLREKRVSLKLDLTEVSQRLNINIDYLRFIEEGQIDKLPVGVYGKNFLKEYMFFLGLDSREVLEFLRDFRSDSPQEDLFVERVTKTHQFLIIPKIIRYAMIALGVLICIIYLSYYIKNIIAAPDLFVDSIQNDVIVRENYVDIIGRTDVQAELSINDNPILIDTRGNFRERINLRNGLNVITVTAQKKYSKKNIITRKVMVQD